MRVSSRDPWQRTARGLRAIPEFHELSSLSSSPDGFGNPFLRNYCVASALRRGTPLAITTPEVVS